MSTTIGGVRIVDMPDIGAVTDDSSVVGEHAGSGRFTAPALRKYILANVANVIDFGAAGDGVTDDTAAIQSAISTGLPVLLPAGDYRVTSQLNFTTNGQPFRGAGRQATFIRIGGPSAAFSAGICHVTNPTSGIDATQYFSDFTIVLAQPDTAARSALNSYPPVFYLDGATRCQFVDVRMVGGLDGIYMNGNCGGFRARGCDFGCFGRNIYIDGNLDVTAFTDCEVWPFSDIGMMTANQQKIFWDANCYGIYSLRNDYLSWIGGLFMVGRAAVFGTGSSGVTYGSFTGTGFDTFGGLEVSAGNILTENCTYSVGGDPTQAKSAVRHTGGDVTVRGAKFFVGSNPVANNALIYCDVPSTDAELVVDGCSFELGSNDDRAVYVTPGSGRYLSVIIANNKFDRVGTGAYTTGMIEVNGGTGTITGNAAPVWTSATNTPFISVNTNAGPYTVSGNQPNGWPMAIIGSSVTAAAEITIPAVFGDAMPIIDVSGTTTIGSMTYAIMGVVPAVSGSAVMLNFVDPVTIISGSVGAPGNFLLNGRTNFAAAARSNLTVRLNHQGNWVEVGRCA